MACLLSPVNLCYNSVKMQTAVALCSTQYATRIQLKRIVIKLFSLKNLGFGCILLSVVASASYRPANADFTVGAAGGGSNYSPFSESYGASPFADAVGPVEYQQVYSRSVIPGTVNITSVGFSSVAGPVGSELYNVTLGLSTTSAPTFLPSTDYNANKGVDFTTVFSGNITTTLKHDGTFDFIIPTSAFTYDPSRGNLLLDILVNSRPSINEAFSVDGTGSAASPVTRVSTYIGNNIADQNGLVTRFGTTAVVP